MIQVHIVDSSIWIDAWRLYPPTVPVFQPIWAGIGALIDAGLLLSPDEVRAEVERGTDGLAPYLKQRQKVYHPLTGADPFVVALALVKQGHVVCAENPAKATSSWLEFLGNEPWTKL